MQNNIIICPKVVNTLLISTTDNPVTQIADVAVKILSTKVNGVFTDIGKDNNTVPISIDIIKNDNINFAGDTFIYIYTITINIYIIILSL